VLNRLLPKVLTPKIGVHQGAVLGSVMNAFVLNPKWQKRPARRAGGISTMAPYPDFWPQRWVCISMFLSGLWCTRPFLPNLGQRDPHGTLYCAILRTRSEHCTFSSMGDSQSRLVVPLASKFDRKCSILEDLSEVGTVLLEPRHVWGDSLFGWYCR